MSIHRTSKSGLFLLELMIIILFFAMTSAVCVRLFAAAHQTSAASSALNHSVLAAQTAAECVKEAGGDATRLGTLLGAQPQADGSFEVFYDMDWQPAVTAQEKACTLRIRQQTGADQLLTATVVVEKNGQSVYEITVKQYLGTGRDTP